MNTRNCQPIFQGKKPPIYAYPLFPTWMATCSSSRLKAAKRSFQQQMQRRDKTSACFHFNPHHFQTIHTPPRPGPSDIAVRKNLHIVNRTCMDIQRFSIRQGIAVRIKKPESTAIPATDLPGYENLSGIKGYDLRVDLSSHHR